MLEQALVDDLTVHAHRALHRADALGYEVDMRVLEAGVVVTLRPVTKTARSRLILKGLQDREIEASAPFVPDEPGLDCIAVEQALVEALRLHDAWLGLVVA